MLFRREQRRFGAWSMPCKISTQGRITIPPEYRDFAGLSANVIVVGVEIGIEIWSPVRWDEEQKRIREHMLEKDRREMVADLGENGGEAI